MLGKKINDITPEEWDNIGKPTPFYPSKYDPVEKPEHYNKGNIEAIAYIKQQLGDNFEDYCYGAVLKYLHRFRYKDGEQDLRKAKWYLEQMIKNMADMGE
tara:strand:+ start:2544 stop:2843 length:300 start_codon:yes stop_codon:yes gene_type:complete